MNPKAIIWISAILATAWGMGYTGYVFLYPMLMPSHSESPATPKAAAHEETGEDRMVMYAKPKSYAGTKAAITSYLGEIQTAKNGQVFAYRSGIVETYLANVGDTVKKWQTVARLLPAEYSSDIANMIADRKAEKTKSEGMVKSARLTLSDAKSRKEKIAKAANLQVENANLSQVRVKKSTDDQLARTVFEQDSQIAKFKSDLDSIDVQIETQRKTIENVKKTTDSSVALESDKLWLRNSTVKTAIRNAHTTLYRIFFWTTAFSAGFTPSQIRSPIYGTTNVTITGSFVNQIKILHPQFQKIDTLTQEESFALARSTAKVIDQGLQVLDSAIDSSEYGESMINADKSDLIDAKTDSMNGILTVLNMYEEQKSMLAKETSAASGELAAENLMLEKLKAERAVAEKEYLMAIAGKDRMVAEVKNMKTDSENEASKMVATESAGKIMSLAEADRMITEWEKMLIDAQSSLKAATDALEVLESAGFSNEVRAPFDGKITKRYVNAGESIAMSSPLFDIVGTASKKNPDPAFARFEIPESDFSEAVIGKEIRFYRTSEPMRKLGAKIVRVSPAIGTASKGIIVEAELEANARDVLVGSTIRVEMEKSGNMLLIPTASVVQSDDGKLSVYTIDEKFTVHLTPIVTERTIGLDVYVSTGITKDSKVVDVPKNYTFLEDGVPVDPMEKTTVAAPSTTTITMPEWHKH